MEKKNLTSEKEKGRLPQGDGLGGGSGRTGATLTFSESPAVQRLGSKPRLLLAPFHTSARGEQVLRAEERIRLLPRRGQTLRTTGKREKKNAWGKTKIRHRCSKKTSRTPLGKKGPQTKRALRTCHGQESRKNSTPYRLRLVNEHPHWLDQREEPTDLYRRPPLFWGRGSNVKSACQVGLGDNFCKTVREGKESKVFSEKGTRHSP